MRSNENFSTMSAQYESQINHLKKKVAAFDLADIMLPHMFRSGRQKLKKINIKKIKALSKILAKKDTKK